MGKASRKRRNPRRQPTPNNESLVPHSDAWFEALLRVDPWTALLTGAVLDRAQRLDVCSICGETSAPIYDLLEVPHLPLRLCSDCADIQRHMGTHIQPRLRNR
jgi:hypothetical protein